MAGKKPEPFVVERKPERVLQYLFEKIWQLKDQPRDHSHFDRGNWIDESPVNGRIRTVCRICGKFLGYRPA
jgi:hypothetical protein